MEDFQFINLCYNCNVFGFQNYQLTHVIRHLVEQTQSVKMVFAPANLNTTVIHTLNVDQSVLSAQIAQWRKHVLKTVVSIHA